MPAIPGIRRTIALPSLDESSADSSGRKLADGISNTILAPVAEEADGDGMITKQKNEMPAGPPLTTHSPPKPRQDSTAILNAFTVDVEDYFQVSAFEKHVDRNCWNQWESRVSANTHRVLELLDSHGVKATFFVLGWNAERHPARPAAQGRWRAESATPYRWRARQLSHRPVTDIDRPAATKSIGPAVPDAPLCQLRCNGQCLWACNVTPGPTTVRLKAKILCNMGNQLLGRKANLEKTEAWYRKAIKLEPEQAEAWLGLAMTLQMRAKETESERDQARAFQATSKAKQLDPSNRQARLLFERLFNARHP